MLAALALIAFVAGIPSGLLALGANPARLLPDRWPDPVPISHWPQQIWATLRWAWITGDLVIWLIVAVAWTGWLAITVSVIVEVIRQTGHGVRAARGLLSRVPRGRWIAGLVAAVLIATSAGTAAASGLPTTSTAATALPWPHPHPATAVRDSAAATATAATHDAVPYTVVHGDTLWDLAERYLGNGMRYYEIVQLNPDLLAGNPDGLEPGWTLLLPPDAAGLPHPTDSIAELNLTVTVQPADTLSGIAERHLGDLDAWHVLFDLNAGRPQPDGRALRQPDQLLPGWHLTLPTPPSPSKPVAEPRDTPPKISTPELPGDPPPVNQTPSPVPQDDEQRASAISEDGGVSLPGGAFVGLGLAALITLATVTARMRRRRWYRPGRESNADPAGLPVVRALRIAHDAATRSLVDDDMPVPALATPRFDRPVEMNVRDQARAIVRHALPTTPETALGVRDGRAIALDLARTQGLGLTGPGARSAARALIVSLLAQASTDSLDATIVIPAAAAHSLLGSSPPDRVPTRLRIVEDMPAAVDVLETELLVRTRSEDIAGHNPATQKPHPSKGNGLLLIVALPSTDADRRMHTILETGSHLALAGLILGPWHSGGTLHVTDDGTIKTTTPALAGDLTGARLFTLPDSDTLDLLALLEVAEPDHTEQLRNRVPADSPVPNVSEYEFSTPATGPTAETSTVSTSDDDRPAVTRSAGSNRERPLHLKVLGRLHLTRTNPEPRDFIEVLAPRQREILVYLALHREGCRRETLSAVLWPDAPADRPYNTFHATLSQLRRGLRRATEDDRLDITITQDGYYALNHEIVTVDLWQLQDALDASRTSTSTDTITALNGVTELYCGDLAESVDASWIDGPREALRRDVLDAFSGLIRANRIDAPEKSLTLLEQARQLDPFNEAIYRDLMRTQARLGQYDSIPRTLRLLTAALSELGERPARGTLDLADALQQPRDGTAARKAS
ncbi:LysM peptidoglycan-binding domain-containing protein [Amycolatopsis sp. cmx-11-12]|uniref:LysM peptidoglycan-binding domain-containing protein n=1 Tax=Amycolatopsis sp. cmx-11-12 TaxID=2785795 RepID=UPI003917DE1E